MRVGARVRVRVRVRSSEGDLLAEGEEDGVHREA